MSNFKNIAVLGSGLLGSAIITQLAKDGFTITVISRTSTTKKELPNEVVVKQANYTSVESLAQALQGQDVAIASLAMEGLQYQGNILDAAIQAGVKRFIPSDFGALTTVPEAAQFPAHVPIVQLQNLLKKKGQEGIIDFTIVSPGMFLEYVLNTPTIIDLKGRSVNLYDNGAHHFSVTSTPTIAKAVSAVLQKPEVSKNRILYINDTTVNQATLLSWGKKHGPVGAEWKETHVNGKEALEKAIANVGEDPLAFESLFPVLQAGVMGGEIPSAYPNINNEILGLPFLSSEELEAKVAAVYQ